MRAGLRAALPAALILATATGVAARRPTAALEAPEIRQALAAAEEQAARAAGLGGMRGLVLGAYSDRDGSAWQGELDEIAALGATHVLVVVQQAMRDVRATRIEPREWLTPSTGRLEEILAGARRRGLRLVLMPTLYIEDPGEGQWRGALDPEDWASWWSAYERFIVAHARLAARHGVEVFVAGSELCSTERRRRDWARLLVRLRRETPDSLLAYSFNWDHLRAGRIADLFDVVGMNAYHDLAEGPGTPRDELVAAWGPIRQGIEGWRRRHGRPLIFTEVGYRSVELAERAPWNYLWEQPYDGEAQARCYRAFLQAWSSQPGLAGSFFYSWRGEGGPGDTGYTPRGKPAEAVLRDWFAGAAAPSPETSPEAQESCDERSPARPSRPE